jgi:hypothetical protein
VSAKAVASGCCSAGAAYHPCLRLCRPDPLTGYLPDGDVKAVPEIDQSDVEGQDRKLGFVV